MNPRFLEGILWLADLQDDFRLSDYKKFKKDNLVLLYLERKERGGFCSSCGEWSLKIHSTDQVRLRDLSAFGYKVILIAERFTIQCTGCKKPIVESHWLHRKAREFTWRFECHISRMSEEMTNMSISRLESLDDKTIFRIDYELLKLRLQHQTLPELGPHYSMDEVYFRYHPSWHPQKENAFITNLLDLGHRKIIANARGRGEIAATHCLMHLSKTQQRQMQSIATDLHSPYHVAIRKHCHNADIVLDRFHVMQLFNQSIDEFRKEQIKLATNLDEIQLLKGKNKWLLLTREEKLSKTDKQLLCELKQLNERIVEALIIREKFVQFFNSSNVRVAKVNWYNLKKLVRQVNIKQINEFFRKLHDWSHELWNYFHHKTSSAVIEAINHKIKVVKSSAYGYRNVHYFQLKILQRAGFLNSQYAPLQKPC